MLRERVRDRWKWVCMKCSISEATKHEILNGELVHRDFYESRFDRQLEKLSNVDFATPVIAGGFVDRLKEFKDWLVEICEL